MTGLVCGMFLSEQRICPVSISAARAWLASLVHGSWLSGASATAYQDGIDHLLWVGPFGMVPGMSQLVQVQILDLHDRDEESVTMGIRWEATGVTGGLFPVLDANITLTAEGDQDTRMTLTGVYRSPWGTLSAGLDRMLLHKVATATIHSLMTHLSRALKDTAPARPPPSPPRDSAAP